MSLDRFRLEREALSHLQGKRKLDRILESEDPKAFVRSLPAEDLYFLVQEIGATDAGALVELASPKQFRSFVDLDAWRRDEMDPVRVLRWLDLANGDDEEAFRAKLHGLDAEVLSLLLRGIVRVIDLEEDGEPAEEPAGAVETSPEGRFLLVYPSEDEYAATRKLIHALYAEDAFQAGRLLYAVRWELESELHESAYRWRNARLADLGFPAPEEAASLYARVDLQAPLPEAPALPDAPPGFFLAGLTTGSLLDDALASLPGEVREAVGLELVALLNAALVADNVPPEDLEAVKACAGAVRDTLSLGLEHLVGDDVERAAALCAERALRRIFQIGFTRTLELKWRADALVRRLPLRLGPEGNWLPDFPLGERLDGLRQRRPRWFAEAPERGAAVYRLRPFATLRDLAEAEAALDAVEAVAEAFQAAGLELQPATEDVIAARGEAGLATVRYSDLFLTAWARGLVGLPFAFRALPAAQLAAAAEAAFDEEGRLRPGLRERAHEALPRGEAVAAFVDQALDRLEGELGLQLLDGGPAGLVPALSAPWIVVP